MLSFGNKEFRNLQEQVLQNARDIATLKGIENLKIVIVEELPEEGNPNYIYLVPNEDGEESNVYNEYIWLADEEAYEQIGAVNIDLTNYVTTDTEQTVTGSKTFTSPVIFGATGYDVKKDGSNLIIEADGNPIRIRGTLGPNSTNVYDLGSSSRNWKNLYLSGATKIKAATANGYYDIVSRNGYYLTFDYYNSQDQREGTPLSIIYGTRIDTYHIYPTIDNTYDLGKNTSQWRNIYVAGNISDGINSTTVANLSTKTTSTYASGTFDANGEDTIDISGGEPEGLFVFTYGNCQCFVRLTATMVQNADLTPISVSCPMIYNSATTLGWLNISRSSDTLTISVVDGTNHVDSGYAWTLTKTNLI